jgi:hypothetical protein
MIAKSADFFVTLLVAFEEAELLYSIAVSDASICIIIPA